MTGGLTDDQVHSVRSRLSSIIEFRLFPSIVETVLFAIFTILICVSTGILLSKGLRNWPNRLMLAATIVMYLSSAVQWALDVKVLWNELNIFLPELLSPDTLASKGGAVSALNALDGIWLFVSDFFSQLNLPISDAVVLWRACVVWNWHKAVVSVALLILTCLNVVNIIYVLAVVGETYPSPPIFLNRLASNVDHIGILFMSLSVFTNIWSTSMVACKAWIHRRDIRRYLQNRTAKSAVENVLLLLVESGIVYNTRMIMLMLTVSFAQLPALKHSNAYWSLGMNQVSGMYPTLVVVLVALQKSHCEHQFSFVGKGQDATLPFSIRIPQSRTSRRMSLSGPSPTQPGTSHSSPEPDELGPGPDVFAPHEKD
ncbi:hypothetical protein OF83DRAFT_1109826 [Amylostereum chailletii]|nr:hypothetical protein OF83DRAFT_1109826 [Amylostereum chailletii]